MHQKLSRNLHQIIHFWEAYDQVSDLSNTIKPVIEKRILRRVLLSSDNSMQRNPFTPNLQVPAILIFFILLHSTLKLMVALDSLYLKTYKSTFYLCF